MLQFPTVGSPKLQTLWCGLCFCARTPLQLNIGDVAEFWLWYKQKVRSFIGNSIADVSDITENFVLVRKADANPGCIYWNRSYVHLQLQNNSSSRRVLRMTVDLTNKYLTKDSERFSPWFHSTWPWEQQDRSFTDTGTHMKVKTCGDTHVRVRVHRSSTTKTQCNLVCPGFSKPHSDEVRKNTHSSYLAWSSWLSSKNDTFTHILDGTYALWWAPIQNTKIHRQNRCLVNLTVRGNQLLGENSIQTNRDKSDVLRHMIKNVSKRPDRFIQSRDWWSVVCLL